jgi:hypothetical protein
MPFKIGKMLCSEKVPTAGMAESSDTDALSIQTPTKVTYGGLENPSNHAR